ncbi:MAG TPA: hypothetical protein GX000_02805 [Actinomyces sp.]|nr:hypothetical protein [Actinomyces sp.]
MAKGKVLVAFLVGAVVVVAGLAIGAIFVAGNASAACEEARNKFNSSKSELDAETAQAHTLLNFLNDENSYGYAETDEGARNIQALRDAISNAQGLEVSNCSTKAQAEKISSDADSISEDVAEFNATQQRLADGLIAHAAPQIKEKSDAYNKTIAESREVAKTSITKANDSEGYGQVDGSLNLLLEAQKALDSKEELPTVPEEIKSIEDLRNANSALDRLAEVASSTEHSASALKESIDKYAGELAKKKAEEKAKKEAEEKRKAEQEKAEKDRKEAERRSNQNSNSGGGTCNDIVVYAEQCTNHAVIHYLASNGWSVNDAWAAAQEAGCKKIQQTSNPCSR